MESHLEGFPEQLLDKASMHGLVTYPRRILPVFLDLLLSENTESTPQEISMGVKLASKLLCSDFL